MNITKEKLKEVRAKFSSGTRVMLIKMDDKYSNMLPGAKGTVKHVDDMGTIHTSWDCGSSLGVVFGEDKCIPFDEDNEPLTFEELKGLAHHHDPVWIVKVGSFPNLNEWHLVQDVFQIASKKYLSAMCISKGLQVFKDRDWGITWIPYCKRTN